MHGGPGELQRPATARPRGQHKQDLLDVHNFRRLIYNILRA